jgi:hypothetical protein
VHGWIKIPGRIQVGVCIPQAAGAHFPRCARDSHRESEKFNRF